MKKVEFLAPGMTQSIDSNGSIQNRPVIQRLAKKFENDKISRKAELKIKPGTHNLKISILPHSVLGEDITLEISNMNKNLIFISGLVIEFIPYIHFCPKMALPSNNFLKD